MGILTTAVHVWVLKKHLLQFLKSCLWLQSTGVSSGSHSISRRLLAEGDGQSLWRELLQVKTFTHSGYPLSWSTHSSITSHESLWSVHCHSKGHSAVSKPSSSPPRGCSELETPNTSEHLYSLWIHYLACLTHMVCKWMPVSLFCFRISGDADRCYSKCGPSASPGDLLEMQNFKPHP